MNRQELLITVLAGIVVILGTSGAIEAALFTTAARFRNFGANTFLATFLHPFSLQTVGCSTPILVQA